MISSNYLHELKLASESPETPPSLSLPCKTACGKLFRKVWKLEGRPMENPSFGEHAFLKQHGYSTTPEIRLQALKYIIEKNTHLYLSAVVDALQTPNLEKARKLLTDLEAFDPGTIASITATCPNLPTTTDLSGVQKAVEQVFIEKGLDTWVVKGSPEEKRSDACAKFLAYLADPKKTTLQLFNLKLTSLPNIFNAKKFKKTKILYLKSNELTALPESFGNLTQLRELHLNNNELTALPESFGNLTQLRELHLKENQLKTLPDSFGNLSQLTKLILYYNKLKTLPDSFGNLSQLTELYLSYNELAALPDSFGNLPQLTHLNLSDNKLEALPDSFGNLPQLIHLNLSDNQLETLPDSFGNLPQLTKLDLSINKLKTLPDSFSNLPQLTKLDLSINKLETLPDSFGNFPQLTELELFDNKLKTLPGSFGNLTQLTKLSLCYNQLEALPGSFGNLTQLTTISLNNNQLKTLPDSFGNLTQLKHPDLSNNELATLPDSFGNLTQLTTLYLHNNPLVAHLVAPGDNWVKYLFILAVLNSREERGADYFIAWLSSETESTKARTLAQFILENPIAFDIYDDMHPLFQAAVNVIIATETLTYPKNPYVVFKKLVDSAQKEAPSAPYQEGVRLDAKKIFVTARATIPQVEVLAVTEGTPLTGEVLTNLVAQFRTRIAEAPHQAAIQAHIQSTKACSLEELLSNLENPFFSELLNRPTQTEVPLKQAMMFSLLKYFLDLSNEVPIGSLLSPREEALCAISTSIQNCPQAKSEGFILTYALLEKKYRYSAESNIDIVAKTKAFIRDTLQQAITNALSSDNSMMRAMTESGGEVQQLSHQSTYLKNLLGPHIGMPHTVQLDPHTYTLYSALVGHSLEEVFALFYTHFTIKTATASLRGAFNRLPKPEQTHIFNGIVEMLESRIGTEGLFDIHEETYEPSLTEEAALELLLALKIGEKGRYTETS